MKSILTEELVRHAIEVALPTIRLLVPENTWGPNGVVIAVDGKGLEKPVVYIMKELGPENTWSERWEGKNFRVIALQKLRVALREGMASGHVVSTFPWLLEEGDSMYQGAAAESAGLAVAASGAYSETDEAVAWIVWNIIWLRCVRTIATMREQGINHL